MTTSLQVTTPSDREIAVTRVFKASRKLVFDAMTKPAFIQKWLLGPPGWTMPVCEFDARVGGKYRYVWKNMEGHEMGMGGVIQELTPPERIVSTEVFDQDWTGGETRVTIELNEESGATRMTLTVLYSSKEARDGALKSGMTEGMSMGYDRLEELLATM
jgi:uncharacterized protein YndB with AHSA1/START domain